MRRRVCAVRLLVVAIAPISFVALACGNRGRPPTPKPKATQAAQAALPEWAPKNPSPAFLRATKVLKPLPLSFIKSPAKTDAENAARMKAAAITWAAAYEFFGTLSDRQVERFLQAKLRYLVIPIKQLTQEQRAAVDRYFEAWRQTHKAVLLPGHPEIRDCVLMLYKRGAKRDLANVVAGFDAGKRAGGGHVVSICFEVTKPDGERDGFVSAFAGI